MALSPEASDTLPIVALSSTASAKDLNALSREQYEAAARALEITWTRSTNAVGAWHALTLCLMNNFAIILIKLGRHVEAQSLFQKAVDEMERRLPPRHPEYYFALCSLATSHYIKGHKARADSLLAKCEAYSDESLPSTLRSCLDAAYLAMSTGDDTLKFKDVSELAYTQKISNETQLSLVPLDAQRYESQPALSTILSFSNLREQGAKTTWQDSHGKWRQWISLKRKSAAGKWAVSPESLEYISKEKRYNSSSKDRRKVNWADQMSDSVPKKRNSESRTSSMIVEVDDEMEDLQRAELPAPITISELPTGDQICLYDRMDQGSKALTELPTRDQICLYDRMDQGSKALTPSSDTQTVAEPLIRGILPPNFADDSPIVGAGAPSIRSEQQFRAGDNELGNERQILTSRPSDSTRSTAIAQWAKVIAGSCIIKEELEEHWLEAQPLPDCVQLSAANLEEGSINPLPSPSETSVSKKSRYIVSAPSITHLQSPEIVHSAAVDPTRTGTKLPPTSKPEDGTLLKLDSPSTYRYKTNTRSRHSTLEHAQSIYSSISRPPPTDRSSVGLLHKCIQLLINF